MKSFRSLKNVSPIFKRQERINRSCLISCSDFPHLYVCHRIDHNLCGQSERIDRKRCPIAGLEVWNTSTNKQMAEMADMSIDYAFYCCDGVYNYNMGLEEAARCAEIVGAKHYIPYHNSTSNPGECL